MRRWWRPGWSIPLALLLMVSSVLPALATPVPGSADPAVVITADGPVQGEVADGYRAFRGIPFAAPPVGELRWQAPQPATPWREVRPATTSGSPCVQPAGFLIGIETGSEDCLYLEVTIPDTATAADPKPVMVWLHGGAFIAGAGSLSDPQRMAVEGDVVVVTLNYRLGVFGFLSFPGLEGAGTFGLQDQQAALRWVRDNIAAFGGDPGNVTLFGESAGGLSICAHLASPSAAGLFQKAIIQSGPCGMSWPANGLFPGFPAGSAFVPLAESETLGTALGALFGCFGRVGGIACLRDVAATALLTNQLGSLIAAPAYGTSVLPHPPATALATGDFTAVPTIIGTTEAEMTAFFLTYFTPVPLTVEGYRQLLFTAFDDAAHEVAARYAEVARQSPALAWSTAMTDRVFACPTLETATLLAARGPVYAYEFADPAPPAPDALSGIPAGAYHASEVQYLLPTAGEEPGFDAAQRQLSTDMIGYWTTFAHTGDPNGGGRPAWSPFAPATVEPAVQSLRPGPDGITPVDYAAEHNCDFWASVSATD